MGPVSAERLNPIFEVGGIRVSMVTQLMASVPQAELATRVTSLDHESGAIFAAIDFLHHGW